MAHLAGFGLENFRVFKKNTWFDFAPITILTGTNNSGKSSVNKALLLLDENLNRSEICNLEFDQGEHELLDFQSSISSKNEIIIDEHNSGQNGALRFSLSDGFYVVDYKFLPLDKLLQDYEEDIDGNIIQEELYTRDNEQARPDSIHLSIIKNGKKISLYNIIFEREINKQINSNELNYGLFTLRFNIKNIISSFSEGDTIRTNINTHVKFDDEIIDFFSGSFECGDEEVIDLGGTINLNILCHDVENWYIKNKEPKFQKFYFDFLKPLMNEIKFVSNKNFIKCPTLKNKSHRLIEDLDMIQILKNHKRIERVRDYQVEEVNEFTEKWLSLFTDGKFTKINFSRINGIGSQIKIFDKQNNTFLDLIDIGAGTTNITKIVLFLSQFFCADLFNYENKTVIIEEPETNLHPALQSKLADLFLDATITFNIQFIIETHSEYLIRRLQFLTAKKEIKPEDTIIHYLFHPESEHTQKTGEQLHTIRIQEDGRLDKEFGTGFFDESTKLMMSILTGENLN